jgi:3-oxoacyl-[acyl-carrier protein] reductase
MVNMMSRLSNKVAMVTGASKGIGAGIAMALGASGARVAVNYSSDREGAERVVQAITLNGGDAIAVGADVSKAADVARLFKEVDSAFGRLDVLVNNAGVFRFGAFAGTSSRRAFTSTTTSTFSARFSLRRRRSSVSGPTAGASSISALSSARIQWREFCYMRPRKVPLKL